MPLLSDQHEQPTYARTAVPEGEREAAGRLLAKHARRKRWPVKDVLDVEDILGLKN